jgi:hypothetical protein
MKMMVSRWCRLFVVAALSGSTVLGSPRSAAAQTTVASSPVGVVAAPLAIGQRGLAFPLTLGDVFVGVVEANTGARLSFPDAHGNVGGLLDPGRAYYVEVLTGSLEGERLDVDAAATIALGGATIVLAMGAASHSTMHAIPDGALAGSRCALRPHVTLADVQAMFSPGLAGDDVAGRADGVWLFENGEFRFYHPGSDNATWTRPGSGIDLRGRVIPPDTSLLVEIRAAGKWFVNAGDVRLNAFRKNLSVGLQPLATGFPADLTPTQARAFADLSTPVENRWTGSRSPSQADEIRIVGTTASELRVFLDANGTTWRTLGDPTNLAETPLLRALSMSIVQRKKSDPAYRIPPPFEF